MSGHPQETDPTTRRDILVNRSRTARAILGATLLAGLTVAGAAQARSPRTPSLAETTVITAASSGWMDVALRDDAVLSVKRQSNPDTQVDGAGRFLALSLESKSGQYPGEEYLRVLRTPAFLGSQELVEGSTDAVGTCTDGTPVGPATVHGTGTSCTYTEPHHIVLHEGYYRLSVLTDGSPVTFTLTLHGLGAGRTELSPTHALASTQQPLPALDKQGSNLVTYGAVAHTPKVQPAYVLTSAKGASDPTFEEESTCVRQDGALPTPAFGYGPHCPNGVSGGYSYRVNPGLSPAVFGGVGVFTGSVVPGHEGDYGIGGSFGDSTGVTLIAALGVWMEPVPAP